MEKDNAIKIYNVIYDGETIIGTLENIETFFRQEMIYQLQDGESFEELQYNFKNIFDIILTIQENEQDTINSGCLFEIKKHPMGNFVYNVYVKVE